MLEGVRLVDEALAADVEIRGAIVSADLGRTERGEATLANLRAREVEIDEVTPRTLSELADTDTPQGIIAVVRAREWSFGDIDTAAAGVVLVIDGVQDPGNVGTLIRTAAALGAGGTVTLKGTADPLNPKTLRGAMGAIFYHPVVTTDVATFAAWLEREQVSLWLADTRGDDVTTVTRPSRLALVVGGEGAGVSEGIRALPHHVVTVPISDAVESLNVSVAAGLLLYEVLRGQ